ncbi:hypothetical protein FACS18948_5160 [Clostridia bacterium]|nr:hypothetical protein FACS18948_5160 [Clostridia bacterium]
MKVSGLPKDWDELPKEIKIMHEEKRLARILKDVPKEQIRLTERLIERAAFMLVTLCDYEAAIMRNGIITKMSQGAYEIDRENPALKGYNSMLKNYTSVIRQLCELLPDKADAARDKAGERLAQFVSKGKV